VCQGDIAALRISFDMTQACQRFRQVCPAFAFTTHDDRLEQQLPGVLEAMLFSQLEGAAQQIFERL